MTRRANPGDARAAKDYGRLAVSKQGRLARITGSELVHDGMMIRRLWRGVRLDGKPWCSLEPIMIHRVDAKRVQVSLLRTTP